MTTRELAEILAQSAGTGIPVHAAGGCPECEAEQLIEVLEPHIWKTKVLHQDDCPQLARIRANRPNPKGTTE